MAILMVMMQNSLLLIIQIRYESYLYRVREEKRREGRRGEGKQTTHCTHRSLHTAQHSIVSPAVTFTGPVILNHVLVFTYLLNYK